MSLELVRVIGGASSAVAGRSTTSSVIDDGVITAVSWCGRNVSHHLIADTAC
jgi:hypothetical protein